MNKEIIIFLIGVFCSLFGWLIYFAGIKIMACIMGGIVGGVAVFFIAFLSGMTKILGAGFWALFIGIPLGMVAGLYLANRAQRLLFFFTGASFGALFAFWLLEQAQIWNIFPQQIIFLRILFHLLFAILGGWLALSFSHYLISFITSVIGTLTIAVLLWQRGVHPAVPLIWLSAFSFQLSILKLLKRRKE